MSDPIVEEVRRIRAEIAAEHGNDLQRIFANARLLQETNGHPVATLGHPERGHDCLVIREGPPGR